MTQFAEVFDCAIYKFKGHDLIKKEIAVREAELEHYLMSAVSDFANYCDEKRLEYRRECQVFIEDLSQTEIEILGLGVAYYWLRACNLDDRLLKNRLNSKDYSYFSPAMLLKEVGELRNNIEMDYFGKMSTFSYNHSDIQSLK